MTQPIHLAPSHLALFVGINALWGANLIAVRVGVEQFPPVFFTCLRFIALALILAPWLRIPRTDRGWLTVAALCSGGLQFALLFVGVKLSSSVSAVAIASQLGVPFTTLLSMMLLGETVRWRRWLGIVLAFAGVAVLGFDPDAMHASLGLAFVVASSAVASFGLIAIKRTPALAPLEMQAWLTFAGLPVLLLLTVLLEQGQWHSVATAGWDHWSALAFSAIGSSLVAHTGFFWLIRRYPVSSVAPLALMSPLFSVLFAVVLLGEPVTLRLLAGGALTLLGVLIIAVREKRLVDTGS